jgi:hypothetical protein
MVSGQDGPQERDAVAEHADLARGQARPHEGHAALRVAVLGAQAGGRTGHSGAGLEDRQEQVLFVPHVTLQGELEAPLQPARVGELTGLASPGQLLQEGLQPGELHFQAGSDCFARTLDRRG